VDNDHPYLVKFGILVGMLFFISGFKSCTDLQYRLRGKTTNGNVSKIADNTSRGRVVNSHVSYGFQNENSKKQVSHYTAVSLDDADKYTIGQIVPIEYFGDEGYDSRIVGSGSPLWTWFFLGSIASAVVVAGVLSWQARSS
jgi:hypothetical protein